MVVPAGIFLLFNRGMPGAAGWGIPMATDIAFCIGCLTLLRTRVSHALVVFVTALAIFDDIGGILVIALFYGHGIQLAWLAVSALLVLVLVAMNRFYVLSGLAWAAVGALLWYTVHHSGIHATIAGVMVGLTIPARVRRPSREVLRELAEHTHGLSTKDRDEDVAGAEILMIEEKLEDLEAPVNRFIHQLHGYVAFAIMPTFALANSGVSLRGLTPESLTAPVALGAALGLFAGKQLGIFALTAIAVRLRLASSPGGASYAKLYGVSIVAGIGFTVALFIAALAYHGAPELLEQAKIGILAGSLAAGLVGCTVLRLTRSISTGQKSGSVGGSPARGERK
jgi:NhaA family Na+:H+ antiporter